MLYLTIKGRRDGYGIDQCGSTTTVADMIDLLSRYNGNTPIYISNDNGYTFGSIKEYEIQENYTDELEEEEE